MIVHTSIPTQRRKKSKKKSKSNSRRRTSNVTFFKELKTDLYGHLPSNKGSSEMILGGDSTGKTEPLMYTGENLIGISIVHKSCLQPVFSEQEAKDFSSMRR